MIHVEVDQLPHTQEVRDIFVHTLERQPHKGEILHWNHNLGNKGDLSLLRESIAHSDEYFRLLRSRQKELVDFGRFKLFAHRDDLAVGVGMIRTHTYEAHVTRAVEVILKPGMAFLDLGANIGYFTCLAASIVGRTGSVTAFEPVPQNVQLIYESLVANQFEWVLVVPLAASDRHGYQRFLTVGSNGGFEADLPGSLLMVQTVRLDDLLSPDERVDLIKMDIEGSEPTALRGMEQLVRRERPTILSEFHPWAQEQHGHEPEDYLHSLVALGYHLHVLPHDLGPVIQCLSPQKVMDVWRAHGDQTIQLDLLATPK